MEQAIEVSQLCRRFGDRPALDGVSFDVRAGEVFGVLGPNGAGKTTTVRLLNGLLQPDGGRMRVWGLDPARQGGEVRRRTGVLTETPSLYERLSAFDNLRFFGDLYGIPAQELPARITETLSRLSLQDRARDKAGSFSKGMKQRLALARAMLHDPPLLFLDEPTAGLDPESADQVLRLIETLRAQGRTIFLCTHRLNEAERVCDRFALFAQGRVLAVGSKKELENRLWQTQEVRLEFLDAAPPLPAIPGLVSVQHAGHRLDATVIDRAAIAAVVTAAVAAGGRLVAVTPRTHTLEEIYFALVSQQRGGTP